VQLPLLYRHGRQPGRHLEVTNGACVMLEPLPKGHHSFNLKGTFPQFNLSLDISYGLIME
jgi:hypothetical protein